MVAKVLRIIDVVLTLAGIGVGCVAIAGLSQDANIIKNTYWSKLSADIDEPGVVGLEFDYWANLWGGVYEFGGPLYKSSFHSRRANVLSTEGPQPNAPTSR